MLHTRSILLKVCLLVLASNVKCQNYDYAVDEGSDDHADFQDDAEHPDYSKYYSVDNSAPLITQNSNTPESNGFVSPIEFSSFFGPPSHIVFGASNNDEVTKPSTGFVAAPTKNLDPYDSIRKEFPEFYANSEFPKDYFEEAQQPKSEESKENEEESQPPVPVGPNYITHKVPSKYNSDDDSYRLSADDEEIEQPINKKSNKKYKNYDLRGEKKYKSPDYDEPINHNKYTDYNIGKSSSTVSQYPSATGLHSKNSPISTLSPYQKYSFQPSDSTGFKSNYLDTLISTVAPFNPAYNKIAEPTFEGQPSENVPSNLKGCKKIQKPVSEAEAVNCYVCEDPTSKSKYTQCSYTSAPETIDNYSGKSERYSTPGKGPDGFRYKRYSNDDSGSDPYEYIKKRSETLYNEPTESEQYQADFQYSPDYYSEETEPEKSFSELQSEELKRHPENCRKIEKSGMTCTVCKNAKTGGNYEQCSYTSEPKEKKYAYVTEKKYDSEQPEESSPVVKTKELIKQPSEFGKKLTSNSYEPLENQHQNNKQFEGKRRNEEKYDDGDSFPRLETKPQQFSTEKPSKNSKYTDYPSYDDKRQQRQKKVRKNSKKLVNDDPYDIPQHFAESTSKERKYGGRGLDPALYGSADSSETKDKTGEYKDIDEYHFKLFPEFENEESRQEQTHLEYPTSETTRQDVEDVLAEFSKKDRSHCKKAEKNGMTCYLCVDKNKIQHEECMYVSESQPKSSHVAYHEVQEVKHPEPENAATDVKPTEAVIPTTTESKRKRFFKKVTTTPSTLILEPAASEEVDSVLSYKPKKVSPKRKRTNRKSKDAKTASSKYDPERLDDKGEPTIKTPTEFEVGDEEGAYSAETKPVYSKQLGVKLPKYMLEKTEFEKEFDEFSGSF